MAVPVKSTMTVESVKVEGGVLYIKVSSDDREFLVNNIRKFVTDYVNEPANNLAAWGSAGVEKAEGPQPYDPTKPEEDAMALAKAAREAGTEIKWRYSQLVRLTRGL